MTYRHPALLTIQVSIEESDAVRAFFSFGATAGENKTTPAKLVKHMDGMAAVVGRLTIEEERVRKAAEGTEYR